MTPDPNQILAEIGQILRDNLENIGAVYGYRTMPSLRDVNIYISYLGGRPAFAVTKGQGARYNYSIVLDVHHEDSEAGRQDGETVINQLEYTIYELLAAAGKDLDQPWLGIIFPRDSTRPPSPESMKNSRLGELFVSVLLR